MLVRREAVRGATGADTVVGRPRGRGQVPRAFVVLKPNVADSPEIRKDIVAFIEKRVAPHKVSAALGPMHTP